jgi:hypothetical protein
MGSDSIPETTYDWRLGSGSGHLKLKARHRIPHIDKGSKVGFIVNRSNLFQVKNGKTLMFPMTVTPSNLWDAAQASFNCDTEEIFGREFAKAMGRRPASVFLAERNISTVYAPTTLDV